MFEKMVYPALEEAQSSLSPQQLEILRRQVESEKPDPTPQSLFNYAWGLVKSSDSILQKKGLDIFARLYRDVPSMRRECLYYLALGSYKSGEYSNARRYAETLVQNEPDNAQAKALRQSIEDKVTQEGLIGLGIAGGVLALGVGLLGALIRKKR
ncbi:mitochondrial fission 1 protein [[Candida] anglica]|uniref:Mitochondrial fission 1 protein n=1 Tax=[Candida] anglica TaxID=148631 RepID=A0ABP0EK26_9ASCO